MAVITRYIVVRNGVELTIFLASNAYEVKQILKNLRYKWT